jgi:hypothetical protein
VTLFAEFIALMAGVTGRRPGWRCPTARPRIQLVFQARSWTGNPEVLEPDRCVKWRWWTPQDLPAAVVPYTRQAIDGILQGRPYSENGWGKR